jgi:UDP-N-acetyl-2-amino-2-deoxyglucuronate dehydrogenase
LTDFVQAIQNGRAPLVDGKEGRRAVEVILGIYESMRAKKMIELS